MRGESVRNHYATLKTVLCIRISRDVASAVLHFLFHCKRPQWRTLCIKNYRDVDNIRSKFFTAAKIDKIRQFFLIYRLFGDHLCPRHHVTFEPADWDGNYPWNESNF